MSTHRTDAQREASRRNGAQSHGPITDAGKARSSMNGLKHGLRAATVVLNNESLELYNRLRDAYICRFRPIDQPELDLVTQMVNAQWRLRRLWAKESALLDVEMFIQHDDLHEVFAKVDQATAQAFAFKSFTVHDCHTSARLDHAEVRLNRLHDRAMRSLFFLQQNRPTEPELHGPPDIAIPLASNTLSPAESITCPNGDPSGASSASDNSSVAEPMLDLPEANTKEECPETGDSDNDEHRYEYQPDWPAARQRPSRFDAIFDPDGPKPEANVQ